MCKCNCTGSRQSKRSGYQHFAHFCQMNNIPYYIGTLYISFTMAWIFFYHLANSTVLFCNRHYSTHIYFMHFSSLIRTKILLPWKAPVQWYLICIIRFMLFICVLKYDLWAPSYLMLYTAWMLFKWKTTFFVCKHILILMNLYNNSLLGIICMCAGDIYMCVCVRLRVCVTHIRVYTHTRTLHVYMSHAFTCWCSLCVCVCVCFHLRWNVCYFIVGK